MSKKDYIAIADVLDANFAAIELVQDMADMLGEDNSRFDRPRFIAAATQKVRAGGMVKVREYKTYAREGVEL